MSLRLEMLQVARLAPKLLGESTELVRDFLLSQQNKDGGFKDRSGKSDLYYTVFGLDGLLALQVSAHQSTDLNPTRSVAERLDQTVRYASAFSEGEGLDLVHLCCLARAWSTLCGQGHASPPPPEVRSGILQRLEGFRRRDGGYNPQPAGEWGTVYGCFLALGAYQDLGAEVPEPSRLAQCLRGLESDDGAWVNERVPTPSTSMQSAGRILRPGTGSTNATAAAVTALRNLSAPVRPTSGDWLLARAHRDGGFLAAPNAPLPDLLSTATVLHALAGLQVSFEHLREKCLDFIDSLWTNDGGFHGHWGDDLLDCEYTYYGLLALGHLSL